MKQLTHFFTILLSALLSTVTLPGQETWKERASERLKPLTEENKRQISEAQPSSPSAKRLDERKILVFWRSEGFIHTSIPWANYALEEMGRKTKAYTADFSDQYSVFSAENLAQYDAIVFNNTTHLKFPEESHRQAILDFINNGKGVVGIHAASDNFYEWPAGAAMMGGQFCGHPWTAEGTYAFKLDEPNHVLNDAFQGKGFWHKDEIYQYDPETYQGEEVLRILVSLDMTKQSTAARLSDPKFEKHNAKFKPGIREVPVTWIREHEKGRVFNTNFGHNESTYTNPAMMYQLLDGIQYAIGDQKADATPSASIKKPKPTLAPEQ